HHSLRLLPWIGAASIFRLRFQTDLPPSAFLTQVITNEIGAYFEQPGMQSGLTTKLADGLVGPEKGLLQHILCIVAIAKHTIGVVEDQPLILGIELRKGVYITGPAACRQLIVRRMQCDLVRYHGKPQG